MCAFYMPWIFDNGYNFFQCKSLIELNAMWEDEWIATIKAL